MQKNLIASLLFSIVIALFAILNAATVPVNLIFVKAEVSAALVILISASLGAIIVFSLDITTKYKLKKQLKGALKEIENLTKNLEDKTASYEGELAILQDQLDALSPPSHFEKSNSNVDNESEDII